MRSPRARHHDAGNRRRESSSASKFVDDDGYSAYESDRRTPVSEYERRSPNGKRTVYSEYTTDADYTDGDRSSYSESDNGKRTPYSEYVTEYTDETDDDRMSGTLGIARNQYCTTLNGLVDGSESSSSESSYSQSTFASNFDQMCNANVNTNCMATLFNRNIDVPGTIHCGQGEHSETQQKMSLPIPLHYMDHLVPSKQELNSALDNFAQKFDSGDEERPGFQQVYKSLFEANLSQTASNEHGEHPLDYVPTTRKISDRNRPHELSDTKAKRESSSKVQKDNDPDILSPPSHIIIKDDFTAVSSAESFGFAPETQKLAHGPRNKTERREGNKRHASPRHSTIGNIVAPHRPSPRHATSYNPSPRQHSSPERPSPRHFSPRHANEKSQRENSNLKPDAPVSTRHGLDRLMRKLITDTSPSKHMEAREEEQDRPENKVKTGLKTPLSGGRVFPLPPGNGKQDPFSFPHVDETRQDEKESKLSKPSVRQEVPTSRTKNVISQLRSTPHRHPDKRNHDGPIQKEISILDECLVPAKPFVVEQPSSSRNGNHRFVNSEAPHSSQKKPPLKSHEYNDMAGAEDTTPLWRNIENSIPHVFSLKPTQTAVSELTGQADDFGEIKRGSVPLEAMFGSTEGNAALNVQILSLKPTPTAVSELTGEAGDFGEARGLSVSGNAVGTNSRGKAVASVLADGIDQRSRMENATPSRSGFATSADENTFHNQTPSKENGNSTYGVSKPNKTTQNLSSSEGADSRDFTPARRSPNKKAETLDRLEDALMGSGKYSFSDQKSRREGQNKTKIFTFEKYGPDARMEIDDSDTANIGKVERQLQESKAIEAQGGGIDKPATSATTKLPQLELEAVTFNRKAGPFETQKMTVTQQERREVRDEVTRNVHVDAMNTALSFHPDSLSKHLSDIDGTLSEDLHDVREGKEIQELQGDDPTTLSALDNEISLLESQITGLEQHDQISDVHLDQVSIPNHLQFEDPVVEAEEALISSVEITNKSGGNNRNCRTPDGPPPKLTSSALFESDRKTSGEYQHHKPPLVPTQQESHVSKRERKRKDNSCSKVHKMQNKSTDATLVTAPTVMTMDTPFTMDAPLVLSQIRDPDGEDRKWDRGSNMLVATAISLPETGCGDRIDINSPFFLVFIIGTKKCFADVILIIVAWMRHLSSKGFIQPQQGRVQVGLMVPPVVEDAVLCKQQLQKRSLGINQLASPSSEEPGTVVETFVPEIWAENEAT